MCYPYLGLCEGHYITVLKATTFTPRPVIYGPLVLSAIHASLNDRTERDCSVTLNLCISVGSAYNAGKLTEESSFCLAIAVLQLLYISNLYMQYLSSPCNSQVGEFE